MKKPRKSWRDKRCESRDLNPEAFRRQILSLSLGEFAFYKEGGATEAKDSTALHRPPSDSTGRITVPHTPERFPVLVSGVAFATTRLVYGLVDPREPSRVRYVGQTTGHYVLRYVSHVSTNKHDTSRRSAWLRTLLEAGVSPDMVLLEAVAPTADLTDRERHWIANLLERGDADLNGRLPRHFVERRTKDGAA